MVEPEGFEPPPPPAHQAFSQIVFIAQYLAVLIKFKTAFDPCLDPCYIF